MPILSDNFLQEVRMKTDIADLISNYVTLKSVAILMSDCVRFITKKLLLLPYMTILKVFTALAAESAEMPYPLLKR